MNPVRFIVTVLVPVSLLDAYNTDTTIYAALNGPTADSFFGYSTQVLQVDGKLKLWTGSPKYNSKPTNASASEGAVFACELSPRSQDGTDVSHECQKLHLSTTPPTSSVNDTDELDTNDSLPQIAFKCSFEEDMCGFKPYHRRAWIRKDEYNALRNGPNKRNNPTRVRLGCTPDIKPRLILSGPKTLKGFSDGILALNPDDVMRRMRKGQMFRTKLTSEFYETESAVQCLRFCFNAYSRLDDDPGDARTSKRTPKPVRSLYVYLKYNDAPQEHLLYKFTSPGDLASQYWNFTEIAINHTSIAKYQLIFQVNILNTNIQRLCSPASDFVFSDISISNRHCKDESEETDVLEDEQSVGMTVDISTDDEGKNTLTTCGSLWQQNCGFAKESAGVCYQIKENSSEPTIIGNPEKKGCIRGKMDIVMLIDQSGSVNQCNFQKVKRWLRNILRGFEIGPNQQDIGLVLYSSQSKTEDVISLGFGEYGNDGETKKKKMLEILHDLPYMAGQTYTGLAFKHGNEMLWGNASRPDALKMILLLTDGATTEADLQNLKEQVNISKSRNASILAVGVAGYDEKELKEISGDRNFFGVSDFSKLGKIRDTLRLAVSNVKLEGSGRSKSMQNCQMGFSLASNQESIVMGAPGCFDLVGDAFSYGGYNGGNDTQTNLKATSKPVIHEVTSAPSLENEGNAADDRSLSIPTLEDLESVLHQSLADAYLGYAVGVGNFFGASKGPYTAASAPRYDGTGCVIIYKVSSSIALSNSHILMGRKYGEYFGAAICSEDINGDGFSDLFVGAPLHSDIEPDEGRVYLYIGGKTLSKNPDRILKGSGNPLSRFGLVISSVGDINDDNIQDIVVSAPNEDDGHGAIYLFPGRNGDFKQEFSQRVAANDLSRSGDLKLFGQSVTGNVDYDGNGYNDILVGTPGSNQIVVLRSRPVVRIISQFSFLTKAIDRRNENCWSATNTTIDTEPMRVPCLQCTVCFSYYGKTLPGAISVEYEIHPDILKSKSRMKFHDSSGNHRNLKQTKVVYGIGRKNCFNHTLYLEKDIDDMLTEVQMKMDFDMIENSTDIWESSGGINEDFLVPTLDIFTETALTDVARFLIDCGDNLTCSADISVLGSQVVSLSGESIETLDYVGSKRILNLMIETKNAGPEEAHQVQTNVEYSSSLSFSGIKSDCFVSRKEGLLDADEGFKNIDFSLKRTFLRANEKCTGKLTFLMVESVELRRLQSVEIHVNSSTISLHDNKRNNRKSIVVPIVYHSSFAISGYTNQHDIYKPSFEILSNSSNSSSLETLSHTYTIRNTGKLVLRNITAQVLWPMCVSMGLTNSPIMYDGVMIKNNPSVPVDDASMSNISAGFCNLTDLILIDTSDHCISESVKLCSNISLFIPHISLYSEIVFTINSIIHWSDFKDLNNTISLISEVTLQIDENMGIFPKDQEFDATATSTIRRPFQLAQDDDDDGSYFPWWIYIVSAAIGIALLLLAIFAMKKAGFFKSKYADKRKLAEDDADFLDLCQPMTSRT